MKCRQFPICNNTTSGHHLRGCFSISTESTALSQLQQRQGDDCPRSLIFGVLPQGGADVACSIGIVRRVVLVVDVLAVCLRRLASRCPNVRDEQSSKSIPIRRNSSAMSILLSFVVGQTGRRRLKHRSLVCYIHLRECEFQCFRKANVMIPSNWDLEICNKGKTWWCSVVSSAHSRFRPPATGLKIARQAADVEQSARHGEAMAFLTISKLGGRCLMI